MRVAVTGSTGLVGQATVRALTEAGHQAVRVVRRSVPDELATIRWDPSRGEIEAARFSGLDAVVHLAGEPIGARRWTEDQKAKIRDSRVEGTRLIAETIAMVDDGPGILLSSSAIGYYGDRGDEILTEESPPGEGFLSEVCVAWEAATARAEQAGARVVNARPGIVLSPDGGALAEQLPFFKLGLGGRFGSGDQWWSWTSIDDMVAALVWLLEHDVSGPINLTAPTPVTNAEYTRTLGEVLSRPTFLRTPKLALWARLGRELAESIAYDSTRVVPGVLTANGFTFGYPQLEPALRHVLDR